MGVVSSSNDLPLERGGVEEASLHKILSFQQLTCPAWPHDMGKEAK